MRQLAMAEGLTSHMNNRKWRAVFATFGRWSDLPPRFRVLDRLAAPDPSEWSRLWHAYPRPFVSLHWVEVELPRPDVRRAIEWCRTAKFAAEPTEAGVRIWGWIGHGDRPTLA
jgi:hypothetical protein